MHMPVLRGCGISNPLVLCANASLTILQYDTLNIGRVALNHISCNIIDMPVLCGNIAFTAAVNLLVLYAKISLETTIFLPCAIPH